MPVDGWKVVSHSLCQTGAALPSHLSQTHLALGSILAHFGIVGLGKLWGIVILIQNFHVHLHNGFFACGVPCRSKGLVTTVGSADASPCGGEGVWMGNPGSVAILQKEGVYGPLEERPGMLFWMKGVEKKRVKLTRELLVRIKR